MSFWRPMYAASTWTAAVEAMRIDALRRNGPASAVAWSTSGDPWLTNAEVVALVDELRRAARVIGASFPSWEQWSGLAYGYDGARIYADDIQSSMTFPEEYIGDLWRWLAEVAAELDRRDHSAGARVLNPDAASWAGASMLTRQTIADNGGDCRVPLPGIPPDQWPTCEEVKERIKKRLPPPDQVVPVLKPIMAIKRLLPLIALGVAVAYLLNDGE